MADYCTLLFAIFNILTEDAQKVVFYLSLEDYNGMLLTINSSSHYHSKFTCCLKIQNMKKGYILSFSSRKHIFVVVDRSFQ